MQERVHVCIVHVLAYGTCKCVHVQCDCAYASRPHRCKISAYTTLVYARVIATVFFLITINDFIIML